MLRFEAFEFATADFAKCLGQREAGLGGEIGDEFANDHERLRACGNFIFEAADHIGELRVHREAEVGGQRPWSRRPDRYRRLACVRAADEWKFHKHRGAFLVLVFHLGFSECGLRAVGPLHGFLRLIDVAVFHQLGKDPQDARLVGRRHREVRIFPIAKHTQAPEGRALDVDEFPCKLRAASADLRCFEPGGFFHDLEFDRQPVAVPARHEGRGVAGHRL